MNVLNEYLIPTREEIRQAKNFLVKGLLSKTLPLAKLHPYIPPVFKTVDRYGKDLARGSVLVQDLVEQVDELTAERNHYRDAADNLFEKWQEGLSDLRFSQLMTGQLEYSNNYGLANKGAFDTVIVPPVVGHDGLHEYDIKDVKLTRNNTYTDEYEELASLEFIGKELGHQQPMLHRQSVSKHDMQKVVDVLKKADAHIDEANRERIKEAMWVEDVVRGNQSLTVKALNNRTRIVDEATGRATKTNITEMKPKQSLTYNESLDMNPTWEGESKKPLPKGAKKAVVNFYDHDRMYIELYDSKDNLLNPSADSE